MFKVNQSAFRAPLLQRSPPRCYAELYAARQALVWVLEPDTLKAPHDMLTRSSREDLRDCPAGNDLSVSSDSPGPRAV